MRKLYALRRPDESRKKHCYCGPCARTQAPRYPYIGDSMSDQLLELLADYAAFRLGCERALELLENPDSSDFDAYKVIRLLKTILEVK
jgi:hypothetical protein